MEIKIEELKEKFVKGEAKFEDYNKIYNDFIYLQKEIANLINCASNLDENNVKLALLNKKLSREAMSVLIDQLNKKGYEYRKNNAEMSKSFKNIGYKLLDQIRYGKKDEVFYSILRIFVSYKEKFPSELIECFKPSYSDDMFKVFIFSFLNGILTKENN